MVTAEDLRLTDASIEALVSKIRLPDAAENGLEYFADLTWSVVCEPGDAFAGKLVDTLGAARALAYELEGVSAKDYVPIFAEAGSDWLEMQSFGKFEQALADARERWKPRLAMSSITKAIEEHERLGGWFITSESAHWPASLEDLGGHVPRGLWGVGNPEALSSLSNALSLVGSRVATSYGETATSELAGPLVSRGYAIVSGGAYGIDAVSHRAALALGGQTIAVMAGGLDRLYPSGNRELFHSIAETGLLLSEMPPGAEPTKWRFLQRNRVIAALGRATVVVEAHQRSGAVSTANRAIEIGRPLGAVPGPINSPSSDGCNQLIRDLKAELITSADDVLSLVGHSWSVADEAILGLGALETRVNDVIGHFTADLKQICSEAGLTRSEAQIGLAGLSLLGLIDQDSNGWRRRL